VEEVLLIEFLEQTQQHHRQSDRPRDPPVFEEQRQRRRRQHQVVGPVIERPKSHQQQRRQLHQRVADAVDEEYEQRQPRDDHHRVNPRRAREKQPQRGDHRCAAFPTGQHLAGGLQGLLQEGAGVEFAARHQNAERQQGRQQRHPHRAR